MLINDILPAYLVGSGLKQQGWQAVCGRHANSPGLFSREWIETAYPGTRRSCLWGILPAYLVGSGLKPASSRPVA